MADWSAASTVSVLVVVSELFITECAAAAVAPAAIAAIISLPLTALAVSLRCCGRAAGGHVDDVGGRDAVADIGPAVAVSVLGAALVACLRPELRRHGQPQRDQVVGVVHVVELGRVDDLGLAIERGTVMKLQVRQLAELIERNDVGGFSGLGVYPPAPCVRRVSLWSYERTVPRQPEISF